VLKLGKPDEEKPKLGKLKAEIAGFALAVFLYFSFPLSAFVFFW
jgi:hypothetical protein